MKEVFHRNAISVSRSKIGRADDNIANVSTCQSEVLGEIVKVKVWSARNAVRKKRVPYTLPVFCFWEGKVHRKL
jgi:hypothetical protein